jgi:type VI secretion system protein ImpK
VHYLDDPFKPSDGTVLRPRPGAGRRAWSNAASPQTIASPAPPATPASAPLREVLAIGLNPLVQAASPLLLLAADVRGTLSAPDVAGLRRRALDEIRRFEDRAQRSGVAPEIVRAARYALCAGIDEAVLSTPWGAQSEWAQQTLLVALHREAWGGEKFFEMLDRISADPGRHIDLMELQYLCIAFGFAGKYQVLDRGHARLAEVQQELYRKMRNFRGAPRPDLSPRWQGLQDRRNPLVRYVPWWVVAVAALTLLASTFVFYYTRLSTTAAPVHASLAKVGLEDFTAPQPVPSARSRLKELLAAEEARGSMSVEEQGGRTVVTLTARNLFGSGSASVNREYYEPLQRLAQALDQVPGRVLVIGHTDDQPLTSLRYRDNYELSRERAVSVVTLLQRTLENPARVEWTGVGSSEPRYRPESEPENRARNRRVEIVHVSGS